MPYVLLGVALGLLLALTYTTLTKAAHVIADEKRFVEREAAGQILPDEHIATLVKSARRELALSDGPQLQQDVIDQTWKAIGAAERYLGKGHERGE
jgi:hypothetical protein